MDNPLQTPMMTHLWKSTLASGALSVLLGALILFWPGPTLLVASVLFGLFLLVSGAAQVFFALSLPVPAGGRVLLFISGAASLILALLAFKHFSEGWPLLLLAIWIAVGFIFRGMATTVSAISDPGMPGRGLGIFFGVVTLIAGIVVMGSPLHSLVVLTIVVGVSLIVTGVFEIVSAVGIRKASTKIGAPTP